MKYRVEHTTKYTYQSSATLCHNLVYQIPSVFPFQQIEEFEYSIQPEPSFLTRRKDFYGNEFLYFSIQRSHKELIVNSNCTVEVYTPSWLNLTGSDTVAWEEIVAWLKTTNADTNIRQYCLESNHVQFIDGVREYALQSFTPGRPVMEAMLDLNKRIHSDFQFTPGFTEISTPLTEVFQSRKGVCQDFAHFGLACLRSVGLAARYMSGYIETLPPPGKPKLVGADASHAWIALFIPTHGWIEFDSTNNLLVADQHIRVATGRDFADIVPMKGIVYSGGGQKMTVMVNVDKIT